MNPQTLSLTNYRAFERATLDLSSVDAAAIVGVNGAGKSSLPEAILFALFGETRSSGVDGPVRLGADEAAVELTYTHNGQTYRIVRKRSRGKRSDLQYHIWHVEDAAWIALTGATIAETQSKIIRDLAMDKTLFAASSFVMQGQSAGICESGPAERKNVLMAILEDRLGKFGPLHDAAKATVKALDSTLGIGRAKRIELEARVAGRDNEIAAKSEAEAALAKLSVELEKAEAELTEARRLVAQSEAAREKVADLERRLADLDREVMDLAAQSERHNVAIGQAEVLLDRADDVRAQCDELARTERDLEESYRVRERYRELGQQYATLKAELDAEAERLGREEQAAQRTLDATIQTAEDQERRAALLTEVPCHGSPMAGECKLIASARKDAENALYHRSQVSQLKEAVRVCSERIKAHSARYGVELEPLRADAQALGFDQQQHQTLENRVAQLRPARELLPQIEGAAARRDAAQAAINEINKILAEKRLQRIGIEQDLEAARKAAPATTDQFEQCCLEEQVGDLKRRTEIETRALAVAEERLARIAEAETELQALATELDAQEHLRTVYATLQEAFSRDGIPALIIDAAIPEIEEHANDVLSRLSDGRMSLKLVTQKAKASGGIAETLDIIVTDPAGERAYEEWSGGERLRIDLAVRIALGRMLASRTGSRIELLVLDEVCSPLDEAGEDALIDCINRLRESFGCILLITHRDALKDRLPQQIVVSRNGAGSEVSIAA